MAARCNYVAQDKVDLQYATKEASGRIAKPRQTDWALLKRLGRYLLGALRSVQRFGRQSMPSRVDAFTDSDWAGCSTTCRSTSGGVIKWAIIGDDRAVQRRG